MLKRKRHLLIKANRRKRTKKETISSALHHFQVDVYILKELNKTIPKALKEIEESERSKVNKMKQTLSGNDKKEFSRFMKWNENPITKRRQFATTSTKLRDIIQKITETFINGSRYESFIKEMSLVYLITSFEEFLDNLLNSIYSIKPVSLKGGSEQMSYDEIIDAKNHEELIDKMIRKKIKGLMEQGFDDINKDLKRYFHLDLSKNYDYDKFKERFYRRNILIHNNLYPDEQYRDLTGYKGKFVRLGITDIYLQRSYSLFSRYATQITDHMLLKFS